MNNKLFCVSTFRFFSILTCILHFISLKAETADIRSILKETLDLGFPVISITTINEELPTVEYVTPPEGSIGLGTINATKVPGKVERFEKDGSCSFSSGDYIKKESGMTLKIRGNTSAYREMKPYKIKLEKKGDLFNRGDKKFNDKNWALIAEVEWREWIGFNVASHIQRQWTPQCEFVNVILNGSYHGLYLLVETIERNEKCRINVSESGYVAEKDPYWWTEGEEYLSSVWHPKYNYTLKYPDWEDLELGQAAEISNDLDAIKKIVSEEGYESYIDISSWIDFVLVHDFLGTADSGGCNIYYTKYDDDSSAKIGMGPAWDFDTSTMAETFSLTHLNESNYASLFNNKDHTFVNAYIARYDEVRDEINEIMQKLLTEGPCDAEILNRNLEATDAVVQNQIGSHSYIRDSYFKWFETHKEILDNEVNKLREIMSHTDLTHDSVKISIESGKLKAKGLTAGSLLTVYNSEGINIHKEKVSEDGTVGIELKGYKGILIVCTGTKGIKLVL